MLKDDPNSKRIVNRKTDQIVVHLIIRHMIQLVLLSISVKINIMKFLV